MTVQCRGLSLAERIYTSQVTNPILNKHTSRCHPLEETSSSAFIPSLITWCWYASELHPVEIVSLLFGESGIA